MRGTTDPEQVLVLCATEEPDVVLLDLNMPGLHGLELLEHITGLRTALPPYVIVLTGDATTETANRALSLGARDFIAKPFDRTEVLLRISNLLELRMAQRRLQAHNRELEDRVRARTAELEVARIDLIDRLALAAEFRDDATGQHTRRVGDSSASVALALGLPVATVENMRRAAPLHDVGKIAIPDSVLLKAGPLSPAEFSLMQTHTTVGARLLSHNGSELLAVAQSIALSHHERWDGGGYPNGLKGKDIPLCARIVAVADFFDALVHDRPYRTARESGAVLEMIRERRGSHFDPDVADAFLAIRGA